MTSLLGPLVLPPSVRIIPVAALSADVRAALGGAEGYSALTDSGSRTPSRLADPETARLLEEFRQPSTVVEAVLRFCAGRELDPDAVLQAVFEPLGRLREDGFLVEPGSAAAQGTGSTLCRGRLFGGFEVLDVCQATEDSEVAQARGPMGIVALKIERAGSSGRRASQPLEHEAAVLEHLGGVSAPRLVARGTSEGRSWLALEWLPGTDAETVARELRAGLPGGLEDRAGLWSLALGILEAYEALHAKGVAHGDVHPRNLLLAPEREPRLIDFGSSAWEGAPAHLVRPQRGGVGFFFEPECARAMLDGSGALPPSRLGDQFLVAALLDLLLTGSPYRPFALTREALLRQVAEEPPRTFLEREAEPWPAAEEVLRRALRKEPEERFPALHEFTAAWRALRPAPSRGGPRPPAGLAAGRRLAESAIGRLQAAHDGAVEAVPAAPSASITFGAAGRSVALLHLARAGGDADRMSLADAWLVKGSQLAETHSGFLAEPWGLTPANVHPYSPYYGECGVPLAAAGHYLALGEPELAANALHRFSALVRAGCAGPRAELDLVLGLAGALLGTANLLAAAPVPLQADLRALGAEVFDRLWSGLSGLPPIGRPPIGRDPGLRGLGLAHGWAGMLYAALRWHGAAGARPPEAIAVRLHQLADLAEPWGRGLRWRCLGEEGRDQGSVTGWCNGSAGFVFLWDEAERCFADPRFAELRTGAAWNAWEGPDEGFDLCCGAAGRSYALLAEYRRTGDERWLRRAEGLAERAVRLAQRQDDAPDALYKGGLGVAVLCVDLERPATAAFPFFEEER